MSVGNSVKKIAAEFNMHLRMLKFRGGVKPNIAGAILGTSKYHISHIDQKSTSFGIDKNQTQKFYFIFPKLDVAIQRNIIEPEKGLKINFELPVRNSAVTELQLPLHINKEIKEPGEVISKKAIHMIRIRKRKMRKHKRKKRLRKLKALIYKNRLAKKMAKEAAFQTTLKNIFSEKDNFSAEKYVTTTLEMVHWEKPVNKVRGRLAPQWVIKEHLENEKEKALLKQRLEECLK